MLPSHASRFSVFTASVLILIALLSMQLDAQRAGPEKMALLEGNTDLAKVSSHLLQARQQVRSGIALAQVRQQNQLLRGKDDLLEIDITLWELTPEIVDRLKQIGMEVTGSYYKYARVIGFVDPDLLDEVASLTEVSTIHPNNPPVNMAGLVTSQADTAIFADDARSTFGIDGSRVTVGVISNSFYDLLGTGTVSGSGCSATLTGSTPQTNGDLPSVVYVPDNGAGGGSDEGRAMAELIHDLAPGADLIFQSQGLNEASLAQAVEDLAACGPDVIVDDVAVLSAPMFQDGIVAQEAQDAVDAGLAYFSSAGNWSNRGSFAQYADVDPWTDETATPPTGVDFHAFNTVFGAPFVMVPAGCGIKFVLQWNEPFSGILGPGASSDLDLWLYNSDLSGVLTSSTTIQGCGTGSPPQGDPLEILTYTNTGTSEVMVRLAVDHYCGNEGIAIRLVAIPTGGCVFPGSYGWQQSIFTDYQIYGHAAAEGVIAVGAVDYREIESGGTQQDPPSEINVEDFSSLGGELQFFFDEVGDPIPDGPVRRFKPEIAAPDNTNTSFFGSDIEPDGWPNFPGTSAAAPHAAAVSALALEADPGLGPGDIRRIFSTTAEDIESPGVDSLSGAGLIDALGAVSVASRVSTDFDGDYSSDLAGLTSDGRVFVTTNLSNWSQVPGSLADVVQGDFNNDGSDDLIGLTSDGRIYLTEDLSSWTRIPGTLDQLVTGNFDKDGFDEVLGLTSDGRIFFTLDFSGWIQIPGRLAVIVEGDYDGEGSSDLAGLTSDGRIYYTIDGETWTRVPGSLVTLCSGRMDSDGVDDLIGLTADGRIFVSINRTSWVQVPGRLDTLEVGDFNQDGLDDLVGLTGDGSIYLSIDLASWFRIPGSLDQVVVADYNDDGFDDLAGLTSDGRIYYSTDLATWTQIAGVLAFLCK